MMKNDFKIKLILAVIILLGAFLRFWHLNEIPPGLYPDVAINGNDALDALLSRQFKVFYPENNGREGLFINLIALSFLIFGPSLWALKIVAALIGTLTIFGTYLFVKELFTEKTTKRFNDQQKFDNPSPQNSEKKNLIISWFKRNLKLELPFNEKMALLASFFTAVSFWHLLFSRLGFRAIMLPFILVVSFYFLLKGFRQEKPLNFILAGIFFGLGFYTYISFRLAVLIIPLLFLFYLPFFKKTKQKYLSWWLLFGSSSFIVALPILIYFLQHPQDFIFRAGGISIFAQPQPIKSLLESAAKHLLMFNFQGDFNWRHNFSGKPMLYWPLGLFFLIGFAFSLKEIIKNFLIKRECDSKIIPYLILFSCFFSMLLPGILTSEGIPHALRVIGVIPSLMAFSALGGILVFDFLKKIKANRFLVYFFLILFLVNITFHEYFQYFEAWAKNPEVKGAFTENFKMMGEYLNSLPQDFLKYVIVNEPGVPVPYPQGIPMPAQTLIFIERTKNPKIKTIYLLPQDLEKENLKNPDIVLLMKEDVLLFDKILAKWTNLRPKRINNFWVFEKIN
jgi:4-amino-4-deoxy-L-arabinose transferase-like glycosyltransferase